MPPPEYYDDFDPEAYDAESERLDALVHQHWLDDLRNLESEADAERREEKHKAPSDVHILRQTFEALDPPPHNDAFEERAEWEWRWLEFLFTQGGNETCLARHHLERGSFIARHTAMYRNAKESVDAFFAPLKRRPVTAFVPEPWPEGDGVSEWRQRFDEVRDPDEIEEEEIACQEPSYNLSLDLRAAEMGWFRSLEEEDREPSVPLRREIGACVTKVRSAFEPDYSPGTIGRHLLYMRRGLEHAQNALDLLDACRGYAWLTPAAYTRLRSLIEDVRGAGLDRYLVMRGIYDGYLERALRLLGGTKWTPPSDDDDEAT